MKEKNKHNPFVGMLAADEEILWFHVPQSNSWRLYRDLFVGLYIRFILAPTILLTAFIIFGSTMARKTNPPQIDEILMLCLMSVISITLITLPLLILGQILVLLNHRQMLHSAYAVTNKRLLRYVVGKTTTIPLEKVSAFPSDGHLFIERPLRIWYDIPEPEEVADMIHEAQIQQLEKRKS